MALISTIVWDNGAGLTRDTELVESLLAAEGHRVVRHHLEPPGWLERMRHWLARGPRYDLNLFIQNVVPEWIPLAHRNALVPNPEHLGITDRELLPRLDAVLCKTRSAVEMTREHGGRPRFVGFTSLDRGGESADRHPAAAREVRALHVAGRSLQKGTTQVLSLWLRHPEWPRLTIVARAPNIVPSSGSLPPNVAFEDRTLDDAALRELQRTHALHLCPSESEGFGHTLVEGMSCGAIVITTDAPPMNELIAPDFGLLAGWTSHTTMGAGKRYSPDPGELERAVEKALMLSPAERTALGSAARSRFVDLDRGFREGFARVVAEVLEQSPVRKR